MKNQFGKIDIIVRTFAALEQHANVNSHQIVTIKGQLDSVVLRKAVHRAISLFPLLLTAPDTTRHRIIPDYWKASDVPFYFCTFKGQCDLKNDEFRHYLMNFSQKHPVLWSRQPPIQILYVEDNTGEQSAIMFNVNHALADAKSDSMLLEMILRCYKEIVHEGNSTSITRISRKQYNYYDFDTMFSNHSKRPGALRNFIGLAREFAKDAILRGPKQKATTKNNSVFNSDALDFHHEMLDAQLDRSIHNIASNTGYTINTIFMAALVSGLQRHTRHKRTRILCPVSLRQFAGPKYNDNYRNFMVPCNIHVSGKYAASYNFIDKIARSFDAIKNGGVFVHVNRLKPMVLLLEKSPFTLLSKKLIDFFQGSNACYSNPGVVEEKFDYFGDNKHKIIDYIGAGCLLRPYDFILYTPTISGKLYLNAIYRREAIDDFRKYLIDPIKEAIKEMERAFCIPRLQPSPQRINYG